jgi:hypothetical protein
MVAVMAIGSLAVWTVIPGAWLWLLRGLEPESTRFLVTIPGCALTMVAAVVLLYRVEAAHRAATGAPAEAPEPPAWRRSAGEDRGRGRKLSLLDAFLAASAVLALVALVAWWALLADSPNPSGPLQPL